VKALVVAATLRAAEMGELRVRRTADHDKRRVRAERRRFREEDLLELLGDMEPEPPPPPLVLPEPDFIAWDPATVAPLHDVPRGSPLAA
jgi:hypothetical protein